MIAKLSPASFSRHVYTNTGADDPNVYRGETFVVNSDPLFLAADKVGTLAVQMACNDVAVSGEAPALTNVMFLPDDDPGMLATITSQLDDAARPLEVAIVGGHAAYMPALERPLLSLTACD